jgi:hypothetical protein
MNALLKASAALTAILLLAMSMSVGCTRKIPVDTSKLDYSFQTADSSNQTVVTEAIESIEKKDYSGARAKLDKVAADPKITPDQKSAVQGVLDQLPKP